MATQDFEPISRTNIGLLGIDIVTVRGEQAVRTALESGDVGRLTDVYDSLKNVPFLFRIWFPLSRFYSRIYGWFLPFRPTSDPSYAPCQAFLEEKFTPSSADISAQVKRAADLLEDTANPPSDEQLARTFIEAIYLRFTNESQTVPANIVCDVGKQVVQLQNALNPVKAVRAKPAVGRVYRYAEESLRSINVYEGLPTDVAVDASHALFTPQIHGANMLRGLVANLDKPADVNLPQLALTDRVLRATIRDGTLGGLLAENAPARRGKTMVVIDIRVAAHQTGSLAWAFGVGTEERRCTAEPAIIEFYEAVRMELIKRRDASK